MRALLLAVAAADGCVDLSLLQLRISSVAQGVYRLKSTAPANGFVSSGPEHFDPGLGMTPTTTLRGVVKGDELDVSTYLTTEGELRTAPAGLRIPLADLEPVLDDEAPVRREWMALPQVSSDVLPADVEPAWAQMLASQNELTSKLRMVPDKQALWQKLRQLGPGRSQRIPENYYRKVSERGDTPVWYRELEDAPHYLPWGGRLVHRDSADLPTGHLADRPDANLVHNRGAIDGRGIGWGTQVEERWPRRENAGWGGTCTCPDGSVYIVSDEGTNCEYLACEHGTPSHCERKWAPGRDMMKVTCAHLDASIDVAVDLDSMVEQAFQQLDAVVNALAGKAVDLTPIDARARLEDWHARQPTPAPTAVQEPPTVAPQTWPPSPAPTPRIGSEVGPLWKGRNQDYAEPLLSPGDGSWSTGGAARDPDPAPTRAPADPGPMPLDRPPATESSVDAAVRSRSEQRVTTRTETRKITRTASAGEATMPPLWAIGR